MGEVNIKVKLENSSDVLVNRQSPGKHMAIRHHEMKAVVDTGAVMLALPQEVTERLGLEFVRNVIVSYADDRREELPVVGPVTIHIGDRQMITECIVLPPMAEALIGQVILESLDLIVDCRDQTLHPRPESPIYPSLKMK